jgi:hypothetical protein
MPVLLTTTTFGLVSGQDVEAKIAAFNEAIGESYNVSNKGKTLIIEGFREGELVKEDRINIYELDMETLSYSVNDNSVSVKCYSDIDGCVLRKLTRERNKKSYKNRIVFGLNENHSGEEIVNKLRMLLDDMAKNY